MDCKHLPKEPGVYLIKNTKTGATYIGSSLIVRKRANKHRADLRAGRHHNIYLQNSYNIHGEESFKVECLLVCQREDTLKWEEHYIEELNPEYNIVRKPASTGFEQRLKDPSKDSKTRHRIAFQSEELRQKLRDASIKAHKRNPDQAREHSELMKVLSNDPEYKWKQSEGTKLAMRYVGIRAKFCALTDEEVIFILQLKRDGHTNRTIAKIMDKKLHTIDDVSGGRTYKHINRETLEVDPDFYIKRD